MEYKTGTVTSEVELANELGTFITNDIGWDLLDTVNDTGSISDKVYFKKGEGGYRDIYVRIRGQSNYLYFYGYTHWVNSITFSDEIADTTYIRLFAGHALHMYWFFGEDDFVTGVVRHNTGYQNFYLGFCDPYMTVEEEDYPLIISGSYADVYSTWDYNRKASAYHPFPVRSGESDYNVNVEPWWWSDNLLYGAFSCRDGSTTMLPLIIRRHTAGLGRVFGELKGMVALDSTYIGNEEWVVVSGTGLKYFVAPGGSYRGHAFGPMPV